MQSLPQLLERIKALEYQAAMQRATLIDAMQQVSRGLQELGPLQVQMRGTEAELQELRLHIELMIGDKTRASNTPPSVSATS